MEFDRSPVETERQERRGGCKYNTSCSWNSRTFYDTQRLRNNVHNLKHTFTYIETTVTNCMSGTTHTDAFTAQYWAHCAPFVDVSSDAFIRHIGSRASQCHFTSSHPCMCIWLFLECRLLPPVFFTSCSSPFTSSWFLPWCLMRTPWMTPCATPPSGAMSAWTMSHPTQRRANNIYTIIEEDKFAFSPHTDEWILLAASEEKPKEW